MTAHQIHATCPQEHADHTIQHSAARRPERSQQHLAVAVQRAPHSLRELVEATARVANMDLNL